MQLTLVLKGEGTLLVGTRMYSFGPNDAYLICANIPHVFKCDASYFSAYDENRVHAITLYFSTRGKSETLFLLPELRNVHAFLTSHYSGFKIPQSLFKEMLDMLGKMKYTHGADLLVHFIQLLKLLSSIDNIDQLAPGITPKAFSDSEGLRISNVYNLILQN